MNGYRWFLLIAFAGLWLWAAVDPLHPDDWLLENLLVFIFVPVIFVSGRYFRLSDISYGFIALFMMMHVLGSHYTYAQTPFGYVLQDWFGADRNMYDRFVHCCFGFLIAYPMREVFMRLARTEGFWSYHFPLDLIIAASAIYEVIEWLVAQQVDITAGIAFLGAQGDIWDAQKDIALAMLGAVAALSIVAAINWHYNENFWREIRSSLRIPPDDQPLGEIRLRALRQKYRENRKL